MGYQVWTPPFDFLPSGRGVKLTEAPGTTAVISAVPRAASPFVIWGRPGKEARSPDYIPLGVPGVPTLANSCFVSVVATLTRSPVALPLSPNVLPSLCPVCAYEALLLGEHVPNLTPGGKAEAVHQQTHLQQFPSTALTQSTTALSELETSWPMGVQTGTLPLFQDRTHGSGFILWAGRRLLPRRN